MKVTITGRHAEFTNGVKTKAREKAEHLERYFDHLSKLEVVFDREGPGTYSCEMIAHAVRGHVLVCHATKETAMAALDVVVGKMERQLVKFKEKLIGRHHRGTGKAGRVADVARASMPGDIWW